MLITMCFAVFIGIGSPTPVHTECTQVGVAEYKAHAAACRAWEDPMSTCEEIHYRCTPATSDWCHGHRSGGKYPIVVFELTRLTPPDEEDTAPVDWGY